MTPPTVVQAALDAANRNDIEQFLASFAPDGIVDDWGREFHGSDAIREWSDREFTGVAVSLTPTEVRTQDVDGGTRTVVVAQVGGRGFNGPSTFTFYSGPAHITRMQIRA